MMIDAIPWWGFGLGWGLLGSVFYLINQHAQLGGNTMVMLRGLGPFLILSPLAFVLEWPDEPMFYVYLMISGIFAAVHDGIIFTATAKFGGGVTSRLMPASVFLVFLAWLAISSSQRQELMESPWISVGVVACIVVAVLAVTQMRHVPIARAAIIFLIPAIILGMCLDVLNKLTMMTGVDPVTGAVFYPMIQSFIIFAVSFGWGARNGSVACLKQIFNKKALLIVTIMALMMSGINWLKCMGMYATPNPAYLSVLGFTAPLWVILYNRLRGVPDKAHVIAGLVFLASAICLILLTGS